MHVRVCLARGADVTYADYDNRTALHVAACEGFDDIVAYLLAHGADRTFKDRYGNTALDDARRNKQPRCVELLEQSSAFQVLYLPPMPVSEDNELPHECLPRLFAAFDDNASGRINTQVLMRMLRHVGFAADHSKTARTLFAALEAVESIDEAAFSALASAHPLLKCALENTNALPNWPAFCDDVGKLFHSLAGCMEGKLSPTSDTYLRANPKRWGMALCSTTGQQLLLGDYDVPFCVDACGKIVMYLIALDLLGATPVHQYVGKEPNGRNFNDLALNKNTRPHNPVLNAGTMMIGTLIMPGSSMSERFAYVRSVWEKLVGGTPVGFDNETYLARLDKGMRCWTLAYMMADSSAFPAHVKHSSSALTEIVEFFFMVTSLTASAQQLAIASATLANGGVNPITGVRVFKRLHVQNGLSIMGSCGLYDHSGEFIFNVGMPAKSGASGGLMAVDPQTMGICTWSPLIDEQGISIRGVKLMRLLSERYNFHVYDTLVRLKLDPTLHNFSSKDDHTADLLFAASKDDAISIIKVLSLGVDVNACDYDRRSALHVAAAEGHVRIMKLLLERGGSPTLRDRWGLSAIDEAKRRGSFEHVRLLSSSGPHA